MKYVEVENIFSPSIAFCLFQYLYRHTISLEVCTFHDGCKQGIDQQIFVHFFRIEDFSYFR